MFFNPFFVQPQQFADPWTKAWTDAHARAAAFSTEGAKMEGKAKEHALHLVDEWARLMKATIEYNAELSAEMRKIALDSIKPAAST
jgi:hypothetical protein